MTAGVRLQAARLAHQQEQANYERRLAADHLQQRRVLKQAATAALAAGTHLLFPSAELPSSAQAGEAGV